MVTGFEAYFVVDMQPEEAKRICCGIEDSHPLGRLMDMDVIVDGKPLSRGDIGLPERRCLVCENPARLCMRAHTHSQEEIQDAINALFKE